MKVLLTGVAGFIGSSLAERLVARGDDVVGVDDFDETLYPRAIKLKNLAVRLDREPRFWFEEGSFLDEALVDRLVSGRPDVVVHLEALAGVRPSIQQPLRYQRVNIEGTLNVLEACRLHGIKRVVFASSSSVYGSRSREAVQAFSETDPAIRPASPYAATKRAGELLCSTYSDLFDLSIAALRFFTVYGPRQRPEMAVHKFTRLISDGEPVPVFGDGQNARDYTFIDDVVDGIVAAIDRVGSLPERFRIYNIGGSRTTTLARLIELIEDGLGKRAILDRQPDQAGDVPVTYADVARAERELGYAPRVPIEVGITRFVKWFSAPH